MDLVTSFYQCGISLYQNSADTIESMDTVYPYETKSLPPQFRFGNCIDVVANTWAEAGDLYETDVMGNGE